MEQVDTGWAWVCLAASFLTMFILSALDYSTGTLQLALLNVFHDDVAKTSVVVVATVASMFCTAPLAGFVVNATNCRVSCIIGGLLAFSGMLCSAFVDSLDALLVTYGIITGIGKSLCIVACHVSVGYNFNQRRSVASGILSTGGGLGIFAGSPLVRFLLNCYGLDGTFLILSSIGLHMALSGMLLRPTKLEGSSSPIHTDKERYRRKSIVDKQIHHIKGQLRRNTNLLTNPAFLAFAGSAFSWNFGVAAITIHIQTFSNTTGVDKDDAAFLMTLVGVGSTLSRLLVGCSTSATGLNATIVYIGQCAVIGVSTVLFPLYSLTYVGQIVYCLLHGLYTGGLNAQLLPMAAEVVELHLLSPAIGVVNFTMGIAWIAGPYLSGLILDYGGTYTHCFILSGGSFLLAVLFGLLMASLRRGPQIPKADVDNIELETAPLSHHDLSDD